MPDQLHHATITLSRTYDAPPERIFSAFANPKSRAEWSAPTNDALIYDEANFQEGGRDVFRCGPANDLRFRGVTTYQTIIPNECVISTEAICEGHQRLAVALTTLEFLPTASGTNLKITIQLVSFVGPGIDQGYESGNRSALDNLANHLAANS
jgi:uncharacterized protein YndB with AHSA1/START domain